MEILGINKCYTILIASETISQRIVWNADRNKKWNFPYFHCILLLFLKTIKQTFNVSYAWVETDMQTSNVKIVVRILPSKSL